MDNRTNCLPGENSITGGAGSVNEAYLQDPEPYRVCVKHSAHSLDQKENYNYTQQSNDSPMIESEADMTEKTTGSHTSDNPRVQFSLSFTPNDGQTNDSEVTGCNTEDSDECSLHADKGWSWMICLSSFMLQMIVLGVHYSFGVIFVILREEFEAGSGATAWIHSIMSSSTFIISPVVSALLTVFGVRTVVITGSILSATGIGLSALVTELWHLYITFGLLTGVGLGLLYVPSEVEVNYWFEKHRVIAAGLAGCGAGIGNLVLPPVLDFLIEEFGWRNTCVLLSGLAVQGFICGALYRPVKTENKYWRWKHRQQSATTIQGRPAVTRSQSLPLPKRTAEMSRPTHAATQISLSRSSKSMIFMTKCDQHHNLIQSNAPTHQSSRWKSLKYQLHHIGLNTWRFSLFRNGFFLAYLISNVLWSFSYYTPFTFLPDRAKQMGVDSQNSSLLLSVVGITSAIGRVLFGIVCDISAVRPYRIYLYALSFVICGWATSCSFLPSFIAQMAYAVVYGLFFGLTTPLLTVILVDLLGLKHVTIAFGMVTGLDGLAMLVGPACAGWVYDLTLSYDVVFGGAGAMLILSGVIVFTIPCQKAYQKTKGEK